ncbi:MAG: NERD domain-containing protein [Anaerolineae bacterium]|nr:NERD domain-containing protein [Anaerolineae bacterium]
MDARLLEVLQLAREGRRETAFLRLRSYLQAQPEDADAWLVLGRLAPDHKIALSALRRAVQLSPENEAARDALTVLEAQGDTSSAPPTLPESTVVEDALSKLPGNLVVPHTTSLRTEPEVVAEFSEASEPDKDVKVDLVLQPADEGSPEAGSVEEPAESEPAQDTEFQALRDARAVVWPFAARRQKKRTLGALLDENQLTRQDLLWAAQEARNEDVRKASQVILETTHRLTDVAMSPEDARLIAWPFRRLNRPLGKLVDTGTVKVKDLRRAAWYAKDARLREAARVMLPVALKRREAENRKRAAQKQQQDEAALQQAAPQSPPERESNKACASDVQASAPGRTERTGTASDDAMARPMPVIQGSDYLANEVQRRYRRNLLIAAVMLLLVLVGILLVLALIVMAIVSHKTPALWLWPLVAVLLLPLFALSDRFVELWQEEQNFRRGQLGESEVARLLRLGLGGDWTLFRNVKLPGSNVDIDMVLLGPPGLFALEVKAYTGNYRYAKQRFYRRAMTWRRMQHNPGKQARAAAGLLHNYITETLNEDIWVEPRLVWVGPGDLMLEEPEVFVWFIAKLDQETERLRTLSRKLSSEKRAALSGLLRGLCSTLR